MKRALLALAAAVPLLLGGAAVASVPVSAAPVTAAHAAVRTAPPPPSGDTYQEVFNATTFDAWSMNGSQGNLVYGKTGGVTRETQMTILGTIACGGTDKVDGGGTNCPFNVGSGLNSLYSGKLIVRIYNTNEGSYCITGSNLQFTQEPCAAPNDLFVQTGGPNPFYFTSVSITNNYGTGPWVIADGGGNAPLVAGNSGYLTQWDEGANG